MTDPLDGVTSALASATPAPDAAKRAETLALASKNFADFQGLRRARRPMFRHKIWTGAKTMLNTLTSRGGLTVTTALVACGILITTPAGRDMLNLDSTTIALRDTLGALATPAPVLEHSADEEVVILQEMGVPEAPSVQSLTRTGPAADVTALALTAPADDFVQYPSVTNNETFANDAPNPLMINAETPVSTFSIDVDTAAYALVRSSLSVGQMPPRDAVRIEEMINYFPYDYPAPDGAHPFQPTVSVFETPWNANTQLVHIALQGELPLIDDRPPLNLVFLIDTSGSMNSPDKLPLLRQSFSLMLDNLRAQDEVAIVTYAGSSTIALPPTAAGERDTINAALNALTSGGSTNGQGGLEQAYALADTMTDTGDVSRVILATDGDFNVGLSDPRGLESYIAKQRDAGTYLSVLGFGRGNLQDATLQSLAQSGNGIAAYIDTLSEAQKVLVDQLSGALYPIANDVKIQVEFNPATVVEYRLIGYETRALNREDFNNDAVDAGELGAGHNVTAVYEITPVGSAAQLTDPLRYAVPSTATENAELGFLRLRYKRPGAVQSQLIETPFTATGSPDTEALFAAAIAGFGQLMRDGTYLGDWGYADAIALANANRGPDEFGYRTQAVQLMRLAQSLSD